MGCSGMVLAADSVWLCMYSRADAQGHETCCGPQLLNTAMMPASGSHETSVAEGVKYRVCCAQEAYGPRGTSGSVAAGEEATLTSVAYQLGYTVKDAGVDFQVPHPALEVCASTW